MVESLRAVLVGCGAISWAWIDASQKITGLEIVALVDLAIHTFDQARFLTGSDAQTVYCHDWNPPGSWYSHEPSAVAIFEMDNDIVYTYRGSWCAEGLRTPWESEWRIIGDKGSVLWDGAQAFRAEVVRKRSGFYSDLRELEVPLYTDLDWPDAEGSEHHHTRLIRDFCDAIRTGRTPSTICTDNIRSLAMVFGAIDSAEREAKVAVSTGI